LVDNVHSSGQETLRQRWYGYFNEPSPKPNFSWVVNILIAAAIIFNMAELMLVSVEVEHAPLTHDKLLLLHFFTAVFFVDYISRVWVAADGPVTHGRSVFQRRMHYVRSPMGVIDLLSFMPGLILLITPEADMQNYSFLKVMTTIRILKLTRYSSSLNILAAVYRENFSTLFAATIVMVILCFTAATGVYTFEKAAQPENLGSIPKAMWWAIVTLTTVGYGDIVPLTLGGKIFGALVMIAGVGIAAIPAGVFASSFVRLIREREREGRLRSRRLLKHKDMRNSLAGIALTASEKREVEFLILEYGLTIEQATSVVEHYRS